MPDITLGCSNITVVTPPRPVFKTQAPQRSNVLVLPVRLPTIPSDHQTVVGPEGTIDYSSLPDGTLVFEY